MADLAALMN